MKKINKLIGEKTEYKDALGELKSFIKKKRKKDNKSNEYQRIHIYAPFGMGKTILVNNLERDIKNEDNYKKNSLIKYDDFLYSNKDVDSIFFSDEPSCNEKNIKKIENLEKLKKGFFAFINITLAILLGCIPLFESNYDFLIKLIPCFAIGPYFYLFFGKIFY